MAKNKGRKENPSVPSVGENVGQLKLSNITGENAKQ